MFTFFLLGLIRGHWDQSEGDASYRAEREMFNTGIAKVTPVTEVLEVLDREELVRQRKQIERDEVAKRGKSTFDSLGAEGDEFERFENLARRLVSVPKKEIDEKRKESGGE
jgi:hypothetical protein